ncbi:MAG: hypothetical protein AAF567_18335 [Actinomycetota bacterium]
MTTVIIILTVIVGLSAIIYVWRSMSSGGGLSDGTPGSVMDAGEEVRRIDMGSHAYAAQEAQAELSEAGLVTRLVTLEEGAFGIGMGMHYYLVYNAVDEDQVRAVVDRLLDGLDDPIPDDLDYDGSGYDPSRYNGVDDHD